MRLENLEQKELRGWILSDVHYMGLKENKSDYLMKKGTQALVVVTTDKEHLKQIWQSSWPRRAVKLTTTKALINKKTSEIVFLDGETDSERLFLSTEKNIKEDIKNQNFTYLSETEIPEAEFPE